MALPTASARRGLLPDNAALFRPPAAASVGTLGHAGTTNLGIAPGISIGAVYLADKYLRPIEQAEAHHSVAGSRRFADLKFG
jgi:hypothetical protein